MSIPAAFRAILLASLGLVTCRSARADVITVGATKDASIYSSQKNNSNGGGAGLFVGTDGTGSPSRSLLSFGLSGVPTNATVTDVKLTMTVGMIVGGGTNGSSTIGIYRLTRDWGEGTTENSTLNPGGIPGTGQGFAANPGDATWNEAAFQTTAWTSAGGDHAAASASQVLTGGGPGVSYIWSSGQMVTDINDWLHGVTPNFGWEFINADEASLRTGFTFYSHDWHTFTNGNASQEPSLQITYIVPEPCAGLLALAGALGCLARRRRPAASPLPPPPLAL